MSVQLTGQTVKNIRELLNANLTTSAEVIDELHTREKRRKDAGKELTAQAAKLLAELEGNEKPDTVAAVARKHTKPAAKAKAKPAAKPARKAKHPKNYNAALGMVRSLLANEDCSDDFRKDVEALLDA